MANVDNSQMDGGGPPAPPSGPGAGAGGPPPGGGPMLAALARNRQGPQVSAPGPGNQADGLTQLKTAIDIIQNALPLLGVGTPMHNSALNALRQLTRHVAQGGQAAAGTQQTNLMDLLRQTVRNGLLQKVMQGQGGGQDGGPPPGQAPNPSTPLPGA